MGESSEVPFPLAGVDVAGEFGVQRPGTTPSGVNVRSTDPILERIRGGSRHGLVKYPLDQIPEGTELIQHLNQIIILSADYLLTAFEDYRTDFIEDPSSDAPAGRRIPPTGHGIPPNRNKPAAPFRRIAVTIDQDESFNGETRTVTATLTRENFGTTVAGQTILLTTMPPGQDGEGDTAITNGSGQATFTVTEPTFEGHIRYIAYHVYEPPV